jgi:hypothetical protein
MRAPRTIKSPSFYPNKRGRTWLGVCAFQLTVVPRLRQAPIQRAKTAFYKAKAKRPHLF